MRFRLGLALAALTLLAYFVPLALWPETLARDWDYFNALNLFVRSAVLGYGTWPSYDPWICGGVDVLINPQHRLFSPFLVTDILLRPHAANLFHFIAWGGLGTWGAYRLAREWGAYPWPSVALAGFWIHGSTFALHFGEGHQTFAAFQAFPWVAWCAWETRRPGRWLLILALGAVLALEGAVYALIFSGYLALTVCAVRGQLRLPRWSPALGVAVASLLAALASRAIPAFWGVADTAGRFDSQNLPWDLVLRAFFSPWQQGREIAPGGYFFHEYGTYLGFAGLALIARGGRQAGWRWVLAAVFWFWAGSGWGGAVNPWSIHRNLPLINVAHVQSRVWVLLFFCVWALLVKASQELQKRRTLAWLLGAALLEQVVVHQGAWWATYERYARPPIGGLIASTTIRQTIPFGVKPLHYFAPDLGSFNCYEPTMREKRTPIRTDGRPGRFVEALFEDGLGRVTRYDVAPGRLTLDWERPVPGPAVLEINQRALLGWHAGPGARVLTSGERRLQVGVQASSAGGQGRLELKYWPPYAWPMLASAVLAYVLAGMAGAFFFKLIRIKLPKGFPQRR